MNRGRLDQRKFKPTAAGESPGPGDPFSLSEFSCLSRPSEPPAEAGDALVRAPDPLAAQDTPAAGQGPERVLLRNAVALLARREFGRTELARRLLRQAGEDQARAVERVLDLVQSKGLLSEERFISEFLRARAARFGSVRLRHELLRRGVDEQRIDAALRACASDEFERAQAIWRRRFDAVARSERERARQSRFLAARGFTHDVIRRVLAAYPVSEPAGSASAVAGDE